MNSYFESLLPVVVELDLLEHVLLRLLPRLVTLAAYQLSLERLGKGFYERVIPWVAWPRHGFGDLVGLGVALECPGSVLGTLVGAKPTSA